MSDYPEDVVERVAVALAESRCWPGCWEKANEVEKSAWRHDAKAALAAAWEWKDPRKELPTKPGKKDYEYVDTLIIKKNGDVLFRPWNCEHLVFDDECYDDFYCDADDVSLWCEVIKPLSPPPEAHDD